MTNWSPNIEAITSAQRRRHWGGAEKMRMVEETHVAKRGKSVTIVSDNGTELTSNAILDWADKQKVGWY